VELKKQAYDLADQQYAQEGLAAAREKMRTDQQAQAIRSQQQFNQLVESGATAAEKRASAEKKLSQLIEKNRQDAKDGVATLWTEKTLPRPAPGLKSSLRTSKRRKAKAIQRPPGTRPRKRRRPNSSPFRPSLKRSSSIPA
jgi:phage-related minor tail protein